MTRLVPATALLAVLLASPVWAQTAFPPDFSQLVEQNSPAIVSIEANGVPEEGDDSAEPSNPLDELPEDSPFRDYFKRFFEQQPLPPTPQASSGSGFFISTEGYLLTNAHVVEGATDITVHLNDRRELKAKLIGTDTRSDVALLKVEGQNLPTVKIGDPKSSKVGQWVLAIGSPFGFDYTATAGIISSIGRNLPSGNYVPFIQTDAAVNPGNSGGPLFNLSGEVIGINSQIYSRTGGYQGVSFAIPIDLAMEVVEQLKTSGKVARGWLGVLIQEVSGELAQSFGLDRPRGALVGQVLEDSPAAKAGIQVGDIILSFNGQAVATSSELPPLVGRIRPGNSAELLLFRAGKEMALTLKIEELPDNPQTTSSSKAPIKPESNRLKAQVSEVASDGGKPAGILVGKLEEGPASKAGLQPGDIILRLDNQEVRTLIDFNRTLKALPSGRPIALLIHRGEGALFLAVTLGD